jgi:hypothetical protein
VYLNDFLTPITIEDKIISNVDLKVIIFSTIIQSTYSVLTLMMIDQVML